MVLKVLTYSLAVVVTMIAGTAHAGWRDVASRYDIQRLSRIDEARAKGMAAARSGEIEGDRSAVLHALSGKSRPISERELLGNWRCRTIKVGGILPGIAYSWFHCHVIDRGGHPFFEKVTGSQRISGYLYPDQSGRYVLLGALSVDGERPHAYSGNGVAAGAKATPDDAIGLLSGLGRGRARIEFPYPVQESVFDVMELRR